MMKKILSVALLGLMAAGSLSAVTKVSQGDAALKAAGADGIMVFQYAADWDRYSKRRCEELMSDAKLLAAAGDAVLMPYPRYETPSKEINEKMADLRGKLNIPMPKSIPAILFFDQAGHHLCTLEGRVMTDASNATLAKIVAGRLKAAKAQADLLEQAQAASGEQKAALIGKACRVPGLNFTADALKQMREADPEDKSGYIAALEANDYKLAEKVRGMELAEGISFVDAILADPKYTDIAKQGAIAGLLALWREKGNLSQIKLMKSYCDKSIAIDPDYYHAKSARQIKKLWLKEFDLASGWFKAMLPTDTTPVEMTGPIPITQAGKYSVRFNFTSGKDGLTIKGVRLYDGKSQVAEDVHDGFAGHNPVDNVYSLNVPKALKNPRLVFTFNQGGNSRNSYGKIVIERQ